MRGTSETTQVTPTACEIALVEALAFQMRRAELRERLPALLTLEPNEGKNHRQIPAGDAVVPGTASLCASALGTDLSFRCGGLPESLAAFAEMNPRSGVTERVSKSLLSRLIRNSRFSSLH